MTRSSGCATFQTSLTPSAHTCGFSPASPKRSSAAPVRCPCVPSQSTVTRATTSEPGSKFGSSSPSRPRPLSPVRTPRTRPSATSSLSAAVSGRIVAPAVLGLLGEPAAELRERGDVVAVVRHRRRRRDARGSPPREEEHRLRLDRAVEGHLLDAHALAEEAPQSARVHDRAREQVRAGRLALLEHRDRHVAQPVREPGRLLEQLAEPDRAGEPGRAGADDQDADVDPLVGGIGGRGDGVAPL